MIDLSINDTFLLRSGFERNQLCDGVWEYKLNGFRLLDCCGIYYHGDDLIRNRYRLIVAFREKTGKRLREFRNI